MTTTVVSENFVVCHVRVDRSRAPHEVLDATGCKQYIDHRIVDSMPKGEGEEVDVVFFRPDFPEEGFISGDDVDVECRKWGLKPADPYSVAAVNEADRLFSENPHGSQWKDVDGRICFILFCCDGRSRLCVYRGVVKWSKNWLLAGIPDHSNHKSL